MTLNPINSYYLTDILRNFLKYIVVIPGNLKVPSAAMLILLLTFDLTLMGKKLITDENFNPLKYLINKTWQFSYILFIILNFSWLIEGIRGGFSKVASLATGLTISSIYLKNPSGVVDIGAKVGWGIIRKGVSANPLTWGYFFIALLVIIGFCMIAFSIVMAWIEYYFLIGISIIFIPCGILETTEGYYKNVFKTIIGCNIKLFVIEFWLYLAQPMLKELKITDEILNGKNITHVTMTVVILGLILLSLPRLAASMLTGSPSMSAGAAMGSAIGGLTTATKMLTNTRQTAGGVAQTGGTGAKETAQGTLQGAKTGGNIGARLGSVLGPVGSALGGTIGTAAGATVGGAYSGAKFAAKTTGNAVKKAFGIKSNSSGATKEETVKNNVSTAKGSVKETPIESNSGVAATTGETRNNISSGKEAEQGGTATVSSVDTGAERTEISNISESDPGTNITKSSDTISTGETRNNVSSTSNDEKKSSGSQNITSGSNTTVEAKTTTGEVRPETVEKKQSIGEIKEPKYNFYDTGGTTKINGVEINEKKKK